MRVFMTGETLDMLFAVKLGVAIDTFRHQLGEIVFAGVVRMKDRMTVPAVELVPTAGVFEIEKMFRVALSALL